MTIKPIRLRSAVAEWYTEDQVFQAYAPATQRTYRRSMDALIGVVPSQTQIYELKTRHFDLALNSLREGATEGEAATRKRIGIAARPGRSEKALGNDVKAFKAFIRFCHRREYMSHAVNPVAHLKSNPGKRGVSVPLMKVIVQPTEDVMDKLLEAAGERHPRDRMTVALGLFAGLRESELEEIRVSGIDLDRDEIRVWRKKQQAWHTVPMHYRLRAEAERYFTWLSKTYVLGLDPEWYALGARRLEGMERDAVTGKILKGSGKLHPDTPLDLTTPAPRVGRCIPQVIVAAGLPKLYRMGSHTLRKMAAVYIVEATGSRESAQTLLGHEHGNTTDIYLQHQDKMGRLAALMAKLKPEDVELLADLVRPEAPSNVIPLFRRVSA